MNLSDLLAERAAAQPAHPFALGPGGADVWTYAELWKQTELGAKALRAAGVLPGMTIGLHHRNGARYVALTYAIWRCGACVVPVPLEYAPPQKQEICRQIALAGVISEARNVNALGVVPTVPAQVLIEPDVLYLPLAAGREHPRGFTELNPAFLRFTSGTTGAAKGVVLSHETIHARIHAGNRALNLGPADRILWVLSMAHHFAVTIVSYVSFGATIVFARNTLGAGLLDALATHKCTAFYGAPTHFDWLAHDRGTQRLDGLRLVMCTTAGLSRSVHQAFHRRFGRIAHETYGIIEVGLPCINLSGDPAKRGSVGRALPDYELRLDDIGLGSERRAVFMRGPGCFDAYYRPWTPRAAATVDGWFATGDVGYRDADGFLHLQGRVKDVISVGGNKFFPQEVEAVLERHPAIAEACVYAERDTRRGELPLARVVCRPGRPLPTVAELQAHCRERLAAYIVPVDISLVPVLPRTSTGKLLRRPVAAEGENP
jgi:long-chain acyl-CoA synthetase